MFNSKPPRRTIVLPPRPYQPTKAELEEIIIPPQKKTPEEIAISIMQPVDIVCSASQT